MLLQSAQADKQRPSQEIYEKLGPTTCKYEYIVFVVCL